MRGKGQYWKGVQHCYYITKPEFLLSKTELRKFGWKLENENEKEARAAWTFGRHANRYLLYHIGYAAPLAGKKARLRRLESGFSKERVRHIQRRYPRQSSFVRKFVPPKIEGDDIAIKDTPEIEIDPTTSTSK